MADVRVTTGIRSRVPGTVVGVQLNTFGLDRLEGITGEDLAPIVEAALDPAYQQALADWPVWTGASRDTIRVEVMEIGGKRARAALRVGGQALIVDPRNEKHIDYAPYVEFNGTATTPPGTILYAMTANRQAIRNAIHAAVAELILSRL